MDEIPSSSSPSKLLDNEKSKERSLSSDSTEFLELPLPPVPVRAVEIQNLDIHPSVATLLYCRIDDSADDTTPSIDAKSSTPEDDLNTLNESRWSSSDEESSFYRDKTPFSNKYDSTCCDEDFTWVRSSERSIEKPPPPSSSHLQPIPQIAITTSSVCKPPRVVGSLDRRRQLPSNRHERDHKSRSTHSLKEKSTSSDSKDIQQHHRNHYHHQQRQQQQQQHTKDNRRDTGYHSETYANYYHRPSPGYWEQSGHPIPPPLLAPTIPFPGYDYPHYWGCHSSRDDLRMYQDYQKRLDYYRYGSQGALPIVSNDELCNNGGSSRYMPACCSCEHRTSSWSNNQRQDIDERLRSLQTDKESLTLQVQVLTEQVSAQNDKIIDLERSLTDKTQLLNNTEDMLQREMLSRSSLETQKLELMSAMSELKLQQAALERENLEIRASQINNNSFPGRRVPATSSMRTSSTVNSTNFHGSIGSLQHSTLSPIAPKTPPASFRHQVNPHFSSLPRTSFSTSLNGPMSGKGASSVSSTMVGVDSNANPKQRNVAFADSERVIEDTIELPRSYTPQPTSSPSLGHKSKGFRSIFGKLRRSNSGNLEDLAGEGDFKRGGVRATAGARLGWSHNQRPNKPFKEWDVDDICAWFDEMGFGIYEEDARKWLKKGAADLIIASPVDIEKELNLKSPLHRKKIVLVLAELSGKETDEMMLNAGKLDILWIMRWLDDIGLPQHKDGFSAAKMDGRMLHKLTIDDLSSLHVTSCLHVASLRRGIQVMRENNWNPECLIRRSNPEANTNEPISLWTAHRVMEWLRAVDLAEYAPNLRGAGVHGALMIYEPKFTAELLADLLSIPPSKTLLRRHLATRFKELLGRDIIQVKRDAENTLGYQPLIITAKIKTPKKSQFSLKRKKSTKGGDEWSDFVCPMGPSGDHLLTTTTFNQNATGISMMNPITQEIAHGSEVASLPTSTGSPTSTRSSNSAS